MSESTHVTYSLCAMVTVDGRVGRYEQVLALDILQDRVALPIVAEHFIDYVNDEIKLVSDPK